MSNDHELSKQVQVAPLSLSPPNTQKYNKKMNFTHSSVVKGVKQNKGVSWSKLKQFKSDPNDQNLWRYIKILTKCQKS